MINCRTIGYKRIHNICENSTPEDEPVILILRSDWVKDVALSQFSRDGYEPKQDKLTSIRGWLDDGCQLDLSIMHIDYSGNPAFDDGRTRSIIAFEKGYPCYPVATTLAHANKMSEHWGSISESMTFFDFSACWDDTSKAKIIGNK